MCWFKKKKKAVITNNKYTVGQKVGFKYRGEVTPGYIYKINLDADNNVIYDIQIGGECPAIISDIREEEIFLRR